MRTVVLGVLLVALLAPVPASTAAPVAPTAAAATELQLLNEITIDGVLRYGRTVKVTRGARVGLAVCPVGSAWMWRSG